MVGFANRASLKRICILSLAALGGGAVCTAGAANDPAVPQLGTFGIDLKAMDKSIKPGDDFYRYVNGHWLATEKIPADQSGWGPLQVLQEQAESDVKSIIEASAAAHAAHGTTEQKIGDFYAAFLDSAKINQLGLTPARSGLDSIAALKDHGQVAAFIADPRFPVDGPISYAITLDQKNPDRYIVGIGQSGLSLPDKEYYLKPDAQFAKIRAEFLVHAEKMLALAGHTEAKLEAKRILELETEIAKLHWDVAKRRDLDLTYNLMSVESLEKDAAAYPWLAAFQASGLSGIKEVVVAEWSAVPPLAKLFNQTPVATWKSYLAYQLLTSYAAVLPKAFDAENFDFNGRVLEGQPQQRERWKRAVDATNSALGEAIGKLYVEKKFPPASKQAMETLVENLRKGYAEHIAHVPWMTAETKKLALEKLAAFRPKIGYPNKWRDYSKLEVKPGDAFGNHERALVFAWNRRLNRLNQPTDRDEWGMTPQTINAYYNPVFNEVVFPAAILQPPIFDPKAAAAVNYGAIGSVIGHEMGHGFDDQGSKSDAKGVLRTWWKPEDVEAFKKRTAALAEQYSAFEPLKGLHLNGQLTLGENIGDLGGLGIAHDAYLISLHGAPAPSSHGYTADQQFFMGWAQIWRELNRPEALRNQVMTDEHSPGRYRVNGVVRNVDAWYTAFHVQPSDKLYLAPEKRIRIW
ncbi:MAG TPA: M13 family metallopeptidase [Steroidobacteraceae bacterium]|nr:M13 family metallopeptidase [Steroidobacteraceae bacterium]